MSYNKVTKFNIKVNKLSNKSHPGYQIYVNRFIKEDRKPIGSSSTMTTGTNKVNSIKESGCTRIKCSSVIPDHLSLETQQTSSEICSILTLVLEIKPGDRLENFLDPMLSSFPPPDYLEYIRGWSPLPSFLKLRVHGQDFFIWVLCRIINFLQNRKILGSFRDDNPLLRDFSETTKRNSSKTELLFVKKYLHTLVFFIRNLSTHIALKVS